MKIWDAENVTKRLNELSLTDIIGIPMLIWYYILEHYIIHT